MSRRDFFKNIKKSYCSQLLTGNVYIYISGGPLSALTCCVNARLLSAIKKNIAVNLFSKLGWELGLYYALWWLSPWYFSADVYLAELHCRGRERVFELEHRSLTGGPRSGSGPKSRPTRTRTYSQNIRLWSKTWRGASISTGTAFVFTVVVVETHRPITCELSHHVIPLSQSSLVNIATRQSADWRESSRLVTHEKTIERKRKIAIHVENKRRDTDDCAEKVEKQASKTEKGR